MYHLLKSGIIDALIRLVTISVKAGFVFILAKYLSLSDFGVYVTVAAVVSLLQYLVAADFSHIAHREFISGRTKLGDMVLTQCMVSTVLFFLVLPLIIFLLPQSIDIIQAVLISLIVFFEALTSEFQRHLVILSKFTVSNLIFFIKSAAWMFVVVIVFYRHDDLIGFNVVVISWFFGLIISFVLGGFFLYQMTDQMTIDLLLFKKYLKTVFVIILGTIAARSIFTLDRIILEKTNEASVTGIYGLYVGIASAFVSLLDAGVLTRMYPKILKASISDISLFKDISKNLYIKIVLFTVVAIFLYVTFVDFFFLLIDKHEYAKNANLGVILIVAYGVYSLSYPLNCFLYSRNEDKTIFLINLFSLFPFLCSFVFISVDPMNMAFLVLACSSFHFILRFILLRNKYAL